MIINMVFINIISEKSVALETILVKGRARNKGICLYQHAFVFHCVAQ
jgi:hypothetical protein